ncbi:MAG TPA: hypothetical protein VJ729_12655 [Nitrososphaeraceae archaeon]|nr:hypothetical protein [Nitrososphaeraceae archaeon]
MTEVVKVVDEKWINGQKMERKMLEIRLDPPSFRIRELEHWLMKKNQQFLNFYSGPKRHTTMNTRIANNDQLIKSCIHDLESSQLLAKIEMTESLKNKIPTPLYSLTTHGIIVLYLIKYRDAEPSDKLTISQKIIGLVNTHLSTYNSYICDFLLMVYDKVMQKRLSVSIIDLLSQTLRSNHKMHTLIDVLNIGLFIHLRDQKAGQIFAYIWTEVIRELDENTRKVIMYHFKADIESQIHLRQPPKDWEEMWIQHIQDCTKYVLYGICNNCSAKHPVLIDFYAFQKNANPKMNCDKCNGRDSLQVYATIP